jgi:E3 ubiquitin-protein ligase RNF14
MLVALLWMMSSWLLRCVASICVRRAWLYGLTHGLCIAQSIYPDCLTVLPSISTSSSNTANPRRITLELPIELASPLPLVVIPLSESSTSSSPTSLQPSPQVDISHLPPLLLIFLLPPAYPFHAPPTLLSLHSTYSWFSSSLIPQFHQVILRLWEEGHEYGEGVLWRITECVRTGEILHLLNLISDKPTTIRIPHASPHLLTPLLQSHTHLSSQSTFSSLTFTCSICFSAFKGSKCHRLSGCQHVFCKECLSGYWQLSIDEGDIEKIACPDVDCVKKKGKEGSLMVEEGELRRLVGDEGVKRWKWLKEKKEIEKGVEYSVALRLTRKLIGTLLTDPTIVLCPIQICQAPVRPPPRLATGEDLGTGREFDEGWDRLRTCQSCSYSFCVHCRRTW